jgi:hypothetical protein
MPLLLSHSPGRSTRADRPLSRRARHKPTWHGSLNLNARTSDGCGHFSHHRRVKRLSSIPLYQLEALSPVTPARPKDRATFIRHDLRPTVSPDSSPRGRDQAKARPHARLAKHERSSGLDDDRNVALPRLLGWPIMLPERMRARRAPSSGEARGITTVATHGPIVAGPNAGTRITTRHVNPTPSAAFALNSAKASTVLLCCCRARVCKGYNREKADGRQITHCICPSVDGFDPMGEPPAQGGALSAPGFHLHIGPVLPESPG